MDATGAFRSSMALSNFLVNSYLSDLTEQECLLRVVPQANHIIWQLGHLIASEHGLLESCQPGRLPPLPDGFAAKYTKETAASDDPATFDSKAELLKLFFAQREATQGVITSLSADDLDQPGPAQFRGHFPTVGSLISLISDHPTLHAGQWVIVRRSLGKPVMF